MPSFLSASHPTRTGSASSHRRSRSFRALMGLSSPTAPRRGDQADEITVEDRGLLQGGDGPDDDEHNEDFLCKPPAGASQKNPAKALRKLAVVGNRRRHMAYLTFVLLVVFAVFHRHLHFGWLRFSGVPPGLYSRRGALVVGRDTPFHIKGLSWYGMEEETHIFGGLEKTSIDAVLDFVKRHRFNAIRVPLSVENIVRNPESRIRNVFANIEVKDATYLDLLRHVIRSAAERHILILLDLHRIHNVDVQSKGLWYSEDFPEEKVIETWQKLCRKFGDEWNIFGADLKNEPWNSTWNSGDMKTDWKRASEAIGQAVHVQCPSWTLFIEGVGTDAGSVKSDCFWSENLAAMQSSPPSVEIRKKVVLSPHVYGPSVYMQPYFKTQDFLKEMPARWDDHFGRASNVSGLATVVGEWGGTFKDKDAGWQRKFFEYMSERSIGFFYWTLNPESSDTGGLLKADWKTPETEKLDLIRTAPSTSVREYLYHFQYFRNWRSI